jgi:hypothetical protein
MTAKEWRSRMARRATWMIPLGVALMGVGAWLASGPNGLTGYMVGATGCFVLVLGALFAKFAAFGPLPANLTRETP